MPEPATGPDLSGLKINRTDLPAPPSWGSRKALFAVAFAAAFAASAFAGLRLFQGTPTVVVTQPTITRSDAGNEILTATGYVVARHLAQVGSKVLGRVNRLYADEGQSVRAGQLLAELDPGELPAQLDQARVELPDARRERDRQEALLARGLTAEVTRDAAITRVASLEARLKVLEAQLEQLRIRAPFNGTIILRNLDLGETISPNPLGNSSQSDRGYLIADLHELEVEAEVNESQIAKLANSQPARVEVDALPGQVMRGRIRFIQPTANRQKATVMCKTSIRDPDPRVRPDMNARVTYIRDEAAARQAEAAPPRVFVPADAVVERAGAKGVWLVEDSKLSWAPVETSPGPAGQVQVTRGLKGTESLVLHPTPKLKAGMAVKTRAEGATS